MVGREAIFCCIVGVAGGLACGEESGIVQMPPGTEEDTPTEPGPRNDPETVIESLESDTVSVRDGSFVEGAPTPSSDPTLAQIVSVTGPNAVTNGGTAVLHVTLSAPVADATFAVQLAGEAGYYTVAGADPDGDGVYDISVKVPADAAQTSVRFSVALLDAVGGAGAFQDLDIALVASGIGDVKVTLSFDRLHDLDLKVVEPTGDQIFYQRPGSTIGGRLDLDAGANCQPSAHNAENVYWPPGVAPSGEYRVSVQNYQQCSPGEIKFTVRIAYDDQVRSYEGSFPDGTAGEEPSATNVLEIATFER